MNDTIETERTVALFVEQVRARLSDLTEEEREELIGGLEADLTERLAEGGSTVADLGDPAAYAAELRAAAYLEPPRRLRRPAMPPRQVLGDRLDAFRARFDALVAAPRVAPAWSFLLAIRPVWWFFRAWLAVQLLDLSTGSGWATPVPTLFGPLPGVLLLLLAAAVSVQVGRGVWWPGSALRTSLTARLVLLGLNAFAVVVTPFVLGQFPGSGAYDYGDDPSSVPPAGIQQRGGYVTNVFPYDAEGRPLTGVQLFDQDGKPLAIGRDARAVWDVGGITTAYPWFNGDQRLYNVFPLPLRTSQDEGNGPPRVSASAWSTSRPPALPTAPLAVVRPAALPTVSASPSASPSAEPSASAGPGASTSPQVGPSGSASPDSEKPTPR